MGVSLKCTTWVKLLACTTTGKSPNSFKYWIRWLITRYIFSSWTIGKMLCGSNLIDQFSAIWCSYLMNRCHQWSPSGLSNKKLPWTPTARGSSQMCASHFNQNPSPFFWRGAQAGKQDWGLPLWCCSTFCHTAEPTWGYFWLQCLGTPPGCRIYY